MLTQKEFKEAITKAYWRGLLMGMVVIGGAVLLDTWIMSLK